MSALTVLYLVLPFPIAFILHDAEETVVQHRWMLNHKEVLTDIWNAMSGTELAVWSVIGVIIMVVNLRFAHWLGMKIKK